jgi:hypothetical protein
MIFPALIGMIFATDPLTVRDLSSEYLRTFDCEIAPEKPFLVDQAEILFTKMAVMESRNQNAAIFENFKEELEYLINHRILIQSPDYFLDCFGSSCEHMLPSGASPSYQAEHGYQTLDRIVV